MLTGNRLARLRAQARMGGWRSISVFTTRSAEQNRDTSQFSPDHAIQLAPVTAVVSYIARAFAASETAVERRVAGRWEMVEDGLPAWADPGQRPNWLQSNYDFRFNLAVNLLIAGRAGVKVLSRMGGVPYEVISVPSHLVYIHPVSERGPFPIPGYGSQSEVVYEVDGEQLLPYTASTRQGSLLYLKLMTYSDLLYGQSPLMWAAPPMRTALAADAYAEYGLTTPWPHGMLTAKGKLTKENANSVQQDFEDVRRDPTKTHIPIVTDGDWEWITLYIPPEQLQLVETRKLSFSQVCAIYNFPEGLISSPNVRMTGAAYRQMMMGYAKGTQIPFNNLITGYLTELLPEGWRLRAVPRHMTIDEAEQSRVIDGTSKTGCFTAVRRGRNLGCRSGRVSTTNPSLARWGRATGVGTATAVKTRV